MSCAPDEELELLDDDAVLPEEESLAEGWPLEEEELEDEEGLGIDGKPIGLGADALGNDALLLLELLELLLLELLELLELEGDDRDDDELDEGWLLGELGLPLEVDDGELLGGVLLELDEVVDDWQPANMMPLISATNRGCFNWRA